MSKSLQVLQHASALLDSGRVEIGNQAKPVSVSITGLRYDKEFDVAASTIVKLYDAAVEFADFEVILVQCDLDVVLELVTDDGNEVGERSFAMQLRGSGVSGEMGMLFAVPSRVSYANYTVNFAGGALDKIEVLRVKNLSTTETARVRILALK